MDFVDGNRGVKTLPLLPLGHPLLITPFVAVQIPDDGGRVGTHFRQVSIRIRFEREIAMMPRLDFELVKLTLPQPGDEISQTPDPPRGLMGWRRPSHWLKFPTTLTRWAFGAHTAKQTPFELACSRTRAPSFS